MRAPMLKACPCCGGAAVIAGTAQACYAKCTVCGLRTDENAWQDNAAKVWNRRDAEGARVVTLIELSDSLWHRWDGEGRAAVWIEKRGGGMKAAVVEAGIDLGETTLRAMDGTGAWLDIPRGAVARYGTTWRMWDRYPTESERQNAQWGSEKQDGGDGRCARGGRVEPGGSGEAAGGLCEGEVFPGHDQPVPHADGQAAEDAPAAGAGRGPERGAEAL